MTIVLLNYIMSSHHIILLSYFILKEKIKLENTFTVPCEKSKTVSFVSSIMKKIIVFPFWSKFAEKLILYAVLLLNQHQVHLVYLNLLQLTYNALWNRDNLINNQLCNHLLDLLQCFWMLYLLISLLTGWSQKSYSSVITL